MFKLMLLMFKQFLNVKQSISNSLNYSLSDLSASGSAAMSVSVILSRPEKTGQLVQIPYPSVVLGLACEEP